MTDTKSGNLSEVEQASSPPKFKIGDTRPAPKPADLGTKSGNRNKNSKRKASNRGNTNANNQPANTKASTKPARRSRRRKSGNNQGNSVEAINKAESGRRTQKKSTKSPTQHRGRYQMLVHSYANHTHTAVMEGKLLTEYSVSRDDYTEEEIYGNIYMGVVKNIYPGTEMAFVDIGTKKNAALHQGDMLNLEEHDQQNGGLPPIDVALRPKQHVLCQVIKNPIAHKGARLTQELSLPGRYVILIPNRQSIAVSLSIPESEKKRLRRISERIRPADHGLIIRTAAANVKAEEITEDLNLLVEQWDKIHAAAKRAAAPSLIYRGADTTFRMIRDKFNEDFRSVIVDSEEIYENISAYLNTVAPSLASRVEYFNPDRETLSLFDSHNIYEQLQKALNSRVWLPSGGEVVIERTEAMTVVDVNTAKNTGTLNLEDTVLRTNLEAAVEITRQLRLRDIGGIIVVDFIDMKDRASKNILMKELRAALAQDPTRTHAEDVSNLGLVQLTRKRIGEGLLDSFMAICDDCEGIGFRMKPYFEDLGIKN